MMRLITLVLVALVVLIQYPLWFGKGGWLRVHQLQQEVQVQSDINIQSHVRNEKLAAEVHDLKEGAGAVEERARYELGMIKDGEVFVQIVDPPHGEPNKPALPASAPAAAGSASSGSRASGAFAPAVAQQGQTSSVPATNTTPHAN